MKTIGEALREIIPTFSPIGVTRCALLRALGTVLSEDIVADRDLPPFDNSAMDGFAVRHADAAHGLALPLCGEARAGGGAPPPLPLRSAMRIFTGAPLPEGADTVVIQENARTSDAGVAFDPLPHAGANVRVRGSDLANGTVALRRGQPLGAGELGLLAALGRGSVSVYQRPRVAIVCTGDELREIGDASEPGTIVNSNAYSIAAQTLEAGAEPWVLPIARDRRAELEESLHQALRADVVLTIGGVSVGEYDLVAQALEACNVERKLWKVAIRPGKPLLFGLRGRVPVLGLPGNPVSAMVTFEVFVKPALRSMLGFAAPYTSLLEVELSHDHSHPTGRTELARARLMAAQGSPVRAELLQLQGSGSLPSMCGVDALLVLDAERRDFAKGSRVPALPLRPLSLQATPPFA